MVADFLCGGVAWTDGWPDRKRQTDAPDERLNTAAPTERGGRPKRGFPMKARGHYHGLRPLAKPPTGPEYRHFKDGFVTTARATGDGAGHPAPWGRITPKRQPYLSAWGPPAAPSRDTTVRYHMSWRHNPFTHKTDDSPPVSA